MVCNSKKEGSQCKPHQDSQYSYQKREGGSALTVSCSISTDQKAPPKIDIKTPSF